MPHCASVAETGNAAVINQSDLRSVGHSKNVDILRRKMVQDGGVGAFDWNHVARNTYHSKLLPLT